jgi:hypothetical protein
MKLLPIHFPGKRVLITFKTTLKNKPELKMVCVGRMFRGFYTFPEKIDFGKISNSSVIKTQTLFVSVREFSNSIQISKIECADNNVKIEKQDEEQRELSLFEEGRLYFNGTTYKITLSTNDFSNTKSNNKTSIKIYLSNGKTLEVPVSWAFEPEHGRTSQPQRAH